MLFGLAHASLFFVKHDTLAMGKLWSASGGLALLFGGFLNLALIRSGDRVVRPLCLLTNVLMVLLFLTLLRIFRGPQVFISVALWAFLAVATLLPTQSRPAPR